MKFLLSIIIVHITISTCDAVTREQHCQCLDRRWPYPIPNSWIYVYPPGVECGRTEAIAYLSERSRPVCIEYPNKFYKRFRLSTWHHFTYRNGNRVCIFHKHSPDWRPYKKEHIVAIL
ncbi:chemokine vCXCL3 [Panine betaherpesvirus 2]|uniref:Chemokine vCXCL3 n=1 Tax=Panine betaherpesvirus 2 TaxID=188763 RepID=Q8QRX7_9BETA|nr:chemokine vCXCL3 [Panine betaherpesvirus 2]AAM00769.1 chemokine vCXCL3 [Panine betaherpesvirus 2]QXV67874.1 chemokine vCXCL3 [Panine betaherpesvirus 2]